MAHYDRLTALDASFLHLENIETPMHVGAVTTFEGAPFIDGSGRFKLAEVRRLVDSRLHLIPRFRKRLMTVPFDQGRPIWVDDDRFDIAFHVRLTALPAPGDREQLLALAARVQTQMLDRTRPLWELWFVDGLEGGKVGLIQKTHHSLVDGVSGVDVATVLLDFTREPNPVSSPEWIAEPPPESGRLLADSLLERVREPTEIVRSVRSAVRAPHRALERATQLRRAVSSFVGSDTMVQPTSLNVLVGSRRRIEGVSVSLADIKVIRNALGGTVNDVVLAGVAGALRRLFESRGEEVSSGLLRVLCPVSVRADSEHMQLGNRVSAMFVDLPIGVEDARVRLAAVSATTSDLKESEQAVGAAFLLDLTQYAAPTLLDLAARLVARQAIVHLVVTNVPGPQVPLYCMGARMIEAYPIVPLSRNLSLGIAVLSYCGHLQFGLNVDPDAFQDLDLFTAALEESFAELTKCALESDVAIDEE